jgi:hypothetical protein
MLFNFLSRPDFIAYDKHFPDAISVKICTKIFRAKPFVWTVQGREEIEAYNAKNICPIFEDRG